MGSTGLYTANNHQYSGSTHPPWLTIPALAPAPVFAMTGPGITRDNYSDQDNTHNITRGKHETLTHSLCTLHAHFPNTHGGINPKYARAFASAFFDSFFVRMLIKLQNYAFPETFNFNFRKNLARSVPLKSSFLLLQSALRDINNSRGIMRQLATIGEKEETAHHHILLAIF